MSTLPLPALRSRWWVAMNSINRSVGLAVRGLIAIMLTLLLAAAVGLAGLHARGELALSVQTASMVPTFRPGDAIIVVPANAGQLKIGQVISYRSPRDPRVIISHRLISRTASGQLITAGDALHTADLAISPDQVVGQVTALAPGLGKILDFLHRPLGLLLAVYCPALGLAALEIRRLLTHYRRVHYRVLDHRAYN
jgi:signal peptidase I